jgi:hypothetical protein
VEITSVFEAAAKIKDPIALCAFVVAAIVALIGAKGIDPTKKGMRGLVLGLAGMLTLIAIVALALPKPHLPDTYRVHVIAVDESGSPVTGATFTTTVPNLPSVDLDASGTFALPKQMIPADGRITIYASKETVFLKGAQQLTLGDELNPSLTVTLTHPTNATVRGIVEGVDGAALAGVRVSVVGYSKEAVTTDPSGGFILPAHAALSQSITLHAEKDGFHAEDENALAGGTVVTVRLKR